MARHIRTPVAAPAYYLGRPAAVWRTALGARPRSRRGDEYRSVEPSTS